jgi:hypothetical protein
MGRVLINISLTPNEKPEKGIQALGPFKEPSQAKFIIRCDLYELNGTSNLGEGIQVEVNIGGKKLDLVWCDLCASKEESVFSYKLSWQCEEKVVDFPLDEKQRPDIFISILEKEGKKRQGYIRLK